MDVNYLQGFTTKCAEAGVDPGQLLKQAGLLRPLVDLLSFAQARRGLSGMYDLAKQIHSFRGRPDDWERVLRTPEEAWALGQIGSQALKDVIAGGAKSSLTTGALGGGVYGLSKLLEEEESWPRKVLEALRRSR